MPVIQMKDENRSKISTDRTANPLFAKTPILSNTCCGTGIPESDFPYGIHDSDHAHCPDLADRFVFTNCSSITL